MVEIFNTDLWSQKEDKNIILSSTQINTYIGCTLSYYYYKIAKIKVPQMPYMVFGAALHQAIEDFYKLNFKSIESFCSYWRFLWHYKINTIEKGKEKKKTKIPKNQLTLDMVIDDTPREQKPLIEFGQTKKKKEILWKNKWAEIKAYKIAGEEILTKFWYFAHQNPEPIMKEQEFEINYEGHDLTGIWDKIDMKNNEIRIIDYKSGFSKPEKNSIEFRFMPQLTLYALAYKIIYGEEPGKVGIHHLRESEEITREINPGEFEEFTSRLKNTARKINNGEFWRYPGWHCKYCNYPYVCHKTQFRKGGKEIIIYDETPEWKAWVRKLTKDKKVIEREIDTKYLSEEGKLRYVHNTDKNKLSIEKI
ncbi:MAG: PD-(D/E)XK nuclease family protein [Candidatus Pacearchaeota archaeon]